MKLNHLYPTESRLLLEPKSSGKELMNIALCELILTGAITFEIIEEPDDSIEWHSKEFQMRQKLKHVYVNIGPNFQKISHKPHLKSFINILIKNDKIS